MDREPEIADEKVVWQSAYPPLAVIPARSPLLVHASVLAPATAELVASAKAAGA